MAFFQLLLLQLGKLALQLLEILLTVPGLDNDSPGILKLLVGLRAERGLTVQIGDAQALSDALGVPVVAQMRLDDLAAGKQPKIGPQIERQTSCPEGGPTSLKEMVSENHDYRGAW